MLPQTHIVLVRDSKHYNLCHDPLRLVDVPGDVDVGQRVLPPGGELGESAGDDGVFAPCVSERELVGGGHLALPVHHGALARDGGDGVGSVRALKGVGFHGELDLKTVLSQVGREYSVPSKIFSVTE